MEFITGGLLTQHFSVLYNIKSFPRAPVPIQQTVQFDLHSDVMNFEPLSQSAEKPKYVGKNITVIL